jgi:hypothetical protein
MARWLILAIALAINVAIVLVALAPSVVTYAEVLPPNMVCSPCTPEAQAAVIRAAAVGRAQIQSLVASSAPLLVGLAIANLAVLASFMWLSRQKPKQVASLEQTAL